MNYEPLNIEISIYNSPKAFATCEYLPFGIIPDEYWEKFAGITDGGKCVTFVVKHPRELHIYLQEDCSFEELIETIGHEIGHFQPKFMWNLDEEKKADRWSIFAKDVYNISEIIYKHKTKK